MLLGSSEAWQRQLYELALWLTRCSHGRLRCRLEHAGKASDVDDIEGELKDLKDKGVSFEHYELPGLERQGDLYVAEGMKTAWFKDPDGNILSLMEGGD